MKIGPRLQSYRENKSGHFLRHDVVCVTAADQWCKQDQDQDRCLQDQDQSNKTKTTGSKQRHLAGLTFK